MAEKIQLEILQNSSSDTSENLENEESTLNQDEYSASGGAFGAVQEENIETTPESLLLTNNPELDHKMLEHSIIKIQQKSESDTESDKTENMELDENTGTAAEKVPLASNPQLGHEILKHSINKILKKPESDNTENVEVNKNIGKAAENVSLVNKPELGQEVRLKHSIDEILKKPASYTSVDMKLGANTLAEGGYFTRSDVSDAGTSYGPPKALGSMGEHSDVSDAGTSHGLPKALESIGEYSDVFGASTSYGPPKALESMAEYSGSNYFHSMNELQHSNRDYKCDFCSYTTTREGNWERHITNSQSLEILRCAGCGYETKYGCNLRDHMQAKHSDNGVYKCPFCSYTTIRKGNWEQHLTNSQSLEVLRCVGCTHETKYECNLRDHMQAKHSDNGVYKCPFCSLTTIHKGNWEQHIMKTKSVEVLKCPQCTYETEYECNFGAHMKGKHNSYKCELCSYVGESEEHLRQHFKGQHDSRVYKCSKCPHTTKRKGNLKAHMRIHEENSEEPNV